MSAKEGTLTLDDLGQATMVDMIDIIVIHCTIFRSVCIPVMMFLFDCSRSFLGFDASG